MKNLASFSPKTWIVAVWTLICISNVHAQTASFEGTVDYNIRVTGKDAQAFLENEPPKKMLVHVKGGNYIISLSGGRIARTMLFIADSNETYIIDAANRRAFKETYYLDTVKVMPEAKPTGKTVDIKGIACKEYLLNRQGEQVFYYVSDLYRVDLKLYDGKTEAKADFMTRGLEGRIPLRKVIKSPNLETMLDLNSVKKTVHAPENFQIPAGFKIKKRDPRK
jgi:hypothetical protein